MLDKEFINRKIEAIQRDLIRLGEFKEQTFDQLASDWRSYAIVKNLLMEVVGRGIDLNQHFLAEAFTPGVSAPLDYTESFLKLGEIGILPVDFAKEIAKSAGFRNAVVHGYNRLDQNVVFKTVGVAIKQYNDYCRFIKDYADKSLMEENN